MRHCSFISALAVLSVVVAPSALCQDPPAAAPKLSEAPINVYSPRYMQVFQRTGLYEGAVTIAGRLRVGADKLEVRITGKSLKGNLPGKWVNLPLDPATAGFRTRIAIVPGGWYKLELRALKDGSPTASTTVEKVGVGEVFVGAGQSNSTNCGQERIKQTSGMVSSFSGSEWRIADDPQPGPHDNSQGGSFWPAFGDAMYAKYGVPIGVAVTGHGGTSVQAWQPGGELFNWSLTRIHQLGVGGFRAVLWHQGESDVAMTPETYVERLTNLIVGSKAAAGWEFPWFVAKVSYHNPERPSHESMRTAHQSLWDKGIALEGPDTDTLTGANRDFDGKGIHFSPIGLKAHGEMWAEKVIVYLDKVLGIKR